MIQVFHTVVTPRTVLCFYPLGRDDFTSIAEEILVDCFDFINVAFGVHVDVATWKSRVHQHCERERNVLPQQYSHSTQEQFILVLSERWDDY